MLQTEQPSGGFHGMTGAGRSANRSHSVDHKVIQFAQQLLKSGFNNFSERERRVITNIATRHHVIRNVNQAVAERQTLSDHLADRVARFGGSWTFIMIFIGILVAWDVLNTITLPRYSESFDPYPYVFLTDPFNGRRAAGPHHSHVA